MRQSSLDFVAGHGGLNKGSDYGDPFGSLEYFLLLFSIPSSQLFAQAKTDEGDILRGQGGLLRQVLVGTTCALPRLMRSMFKPCGTTIAKFG